MNRVSLLFLCVVACESGSQEPGALVSAPAVSQPNSGESTGAAAPDEPAGTTSAERELNAIGAATAETEPDAVGAAAVEHEPGADQRCQDDFDRLVAEAGLPGTPNLEQERVAIFGRVKAEPVVFVDKPEFAQDVPRDVRRYRGVLTTTPYPWDYLKIITQNFEYNSELARQTLLRDGYLYAETQGLAYALVDHVRANLLFEEPRFWIQRGEKTLYARKNERGEYVYDNGPQQNEPVQLLLFDRVGLGEPGPALHRDVRSLRYRLHFERFEVVRYAADRIAANLRYGELVVPTVLKTDGPRVDLHCEIVPPERAEELRNFRDRQARLASVLSPLRAAMLAEVDEKLPFDEPLTEAGQQDGYLRARWLNAYNAGQSRYEFNGDEYQVFDVRGRPLVPQVCVDFLTDTLERASGTWWRKKGEPRGRTTGGLDFRTIAPELPRRVPDFVEFARGKPDWFQVYDTPERERIAFKKGARFYQYLMQSPTRYRPGDIIIIRGYTPFERVWERPVMHYHSFFVYESDPVTAMPYLIIGNAGRPSMRTWEFEIRRTPKRSIWYRIRPELAWLESVFDKPDVLEPPTLTVGPVQGS